MSIFLGAFLLLTGSAGIADEPKRSWEAMISARTLNVRAGPGESHPIVGKLKRGDKARAFDEDGRWIHIREFDDTDAMGWVHRSFVRLPKEFMAPAFGEAENNFLEWASQRGDLSEVSVEADDRISIVLGPGVAVEGAGAIARDVACTWRDLLDPKVAVTAVVWPDTGTGAGWLTQTRCP
ncbi:MAG: SH3 domain-containing protein [Alphaproteobacteria bacterium]